MDPFNQTFLLVQSSQTEIALGQSIDYVQDVFGTERCWGGETMKKQCDDCSESQPRYRRSLRTSGGLEFWS